MSRRSKNGRAQEIERARARAERAAAREAAAASSAVSENAVGRAPEQVTPRPPAASRVSPGRPFPLWSLWLIALVVVLAIAGTAAAAIYTRSRPGVEVPTLQDQAVDETPPVQVPSVVGINVDDATALLLASALSTPTITLEYAEGIPEGSVIAQEPAGDLVVMSGSPVALVVSRGPAPAPTDSVKMEAVKKFSGSYSPKSVVATQRGLIFSQNMMYRHTVVVFDAVTYEPVKTIPDRVTLADFGYSEYPGSVQGGPVEAAATPDGKYMYVSQYSMFGPGFSNPGDDDQGPEAGADPSFVYRIPTDTLEIDQVIKVGSVPKYVAVTPDSRYVLVTNWVSYTLSVIDVAQGREIKTIKLGRHPRGIAVDSSSTVAYVAVMGSSSIAKVDLNDFSISWINGVGSTPRHVVISPDDRYLYATLNIPNQVVKIDLGTEKVVGRVSTGSQPRSMAIAEDGRSLYVVNYESDSVSKVRAEDMVELQELPVGHHPIGITYVNDSREIWVCCYSGSFHIFRDPVR